MPLVQRTWSKPGLARTASIHRREAVATVGVRGLLIELDRARRRGERAFEHGDLWPGAEQPAQPGGERRLRLDRDHPGAEAGKAAGVIADMGADVERQIARAEERGIVPAQRARAPGLPVVDRERAGEPERAREAVRHLPPPFEIGRRH